MCRTGLVARGRRGDLADPNAEWGSRVTAGRRHLATLLKEHALVEGGDLQVATWIKDEGFDTTVTSVLQVGLKAGHPARLPGCCACSPCSANAAHLSWLAPRK